MLVKFLQNRQLHQAYRVLFSQKRNIESIPTLDKFLQNQQLTQNTLVNSDGPKFFIETYGCQMNSNDSQIVASILNNDGYSQTNNIEDASIVLLNTCAIRENAENKVIQRLSELKQRNKVLGLLGCMAERLKDQLFQKGADIIVGPDAYKTLPLLLENYIETNTKQINTELSFTETYDDIMPINPQDAITTYVSIMRGCNNMCSFCVVPFTRGRERSRNPDSIYKEIEQLQEQGVKEITLLGQNVNSYYYASNEVESQHENTAGFTEMYKLRQGNGIRFDQLLDKIASQFQQMRIRFISPHPKNFPPKLLDVISKHPNICKNIHIPIQSGSNKILQKMRRNYTSEAVIDLCKDVRARLPNVTLSTDVIVGFCDEDDQDFKQTLNLMENIQFDNAFMFAYSMRAKTHAHRNYEDNIKEEVKLKRLDQLIQIQHRIMLEKNKQELGKLHTVLVEQNGNLDNQLKGRSDTNKTIVFQNEENNYAKGDFVKVIIEKAGLKTLIGKAIEKKHQQNIID